MSNIIILNTVRVSITEIYDPLGDQSKSSKSCVSV